MPIGHADNIEGPEKECDVLKNQGSERHRGPQVQGRLSGWMRGTHWTCKKEQDIEKEKRGYSCQGEWREEKDQHGNEAGIAGVDFVCGGLDVKLDRIWRSIRQINSALMDGLSNCGAGEDS